MHTNHLLLHLVPIHHTHYTKGLLQNTSKVQNSLKMFQCPQEVGEKPVSHLTTCSTFSDLVVAWDHESNPINLTGYLAQKEGIGNVFASLALDGGCQGTPHLSKRLYSCSWSPSLSITPFVHQETAVPAWQKSQKSTARAEIPFADGRVVDGHLGEFLPNFWFYPGMGKKFSPSKPDPIRSAPKECLHRQEMIKMPPRMTF